MSTVREEVATVARDMLEGRLELQAGCRAITALSCSLFKSEQNDRNILVFVGVDSELDGFPMGRVRQHWAPDALAEMDKQRDEYLSCVRDNILAACRALSGWR